MRTIMRDGGSGRALRLLLIGAAARNGPRCCRGYISRAQAARIIEPEEPDTPASAFQIFDPLKVVGPELSGLTASIRQMVGSRDVLLNRVAQYYVQGEGKHLRPLLVLLISKATAEGRPAGNVVNVDAEISPRHVLNDVNPNAPLPPPSSARSILPAQRRLAEISEMIHAASLLHDDVIDGSATRRGQPASQIQYGNKLTILAGDFLLGRASQALARLRNCEVVELLSSVIANLIEGELLQLRNTASETETRPTPEVFEYYLRKTYLKTASLMAKSCRAAAILGDCSAEVVEAAYEYGRNIGLAFQLVDDLLDYATHDIGKPSHADLAAGLATGPVLYAWQDFPELGPMIKRQFREPGDVERARGLVAASNGIAQTRELAQSHADKARAALSVLPDSEAKQALEQLTETVMTRKK